MNNFPDPEDWTVGNKMHADIWKYGHIELHFLENKLTTIYSDHFNYVSVGVEDDSVKLEQKTEVLDGGKSLEIRPWIIDAKLTITEAFATLLTENIDFYVQTKPFELDEHFINIILKSGVTLSFRGNQNADINDCQLGAFRFNRINSE